MVTKGEVGERLGGIFADLLALRADMQEATTNGGNGDDLESGTLSEIALHIMECVAQIGAIVQPPTQEGDSLARVARVDR